MRGAWPLAIFLGALVAPAIASAGNTDEVNAGLDVTLTGGAIVAVTYTGAALWYNPAGLARIDKPSLELTGVTIRFEILNNPGLVTIDANPPAQSEGSGFNVVVVPQAITFSLKLKNENLKLGVGLFNSSIRREFLSEQVASTEGSSPQVEAYAGQDSRLDFFHISTGMAARLAEKRKQKVLLGGAFDLVFGNARVDESYAVFYDQGQAGQINSSQVSTTTGFGFQLKAGIQWIPVPKIRIGFSVASPAYLFAAIQRFSTGYSQAPPAGTSYDPDDPNRQLATGDEGRGGKGVWWGVEPGNLRFGVAYVRDWGWIEVDLVYYFRLQQEQLGLDLRGFANGRFGSAFRVTKNFQLGVGAFTDFSQVDALAQSLLSSRDVNFYGVHLGFLYSNEEVHPDRRSGEDRERLVLSIAVGINYAHGRGDTLGLLVSPQYDPSSVRDCTEGDGSSGCASIPTKINQISINLAAKVAF